MGRVSNKDILERVNEKRTSLETIKKRKSMGGKHNESKRNINDDTRRAGEGNRKRLKITDDVKNGNNRSTKQMVRGRHTRRHQYCQGPAIRQNT